MPVNMESDSSVNVISHLSSRSGAEKKSFKASEPEVRFDLSFHEISAGKEAQSQQNMQGSFDFESLESSAASEIDSLTDTAHSSRAEIDTSAPFASVKDAAMMFGGAADWKAQRNSAMQKRLHIDDELKKAARQVAELRRCLAVTAEERQQILKETLGTKNLVEKLASKMENCLVEEEISSASSLTLSGNVEKEDGNLYATNKSWKTELEIETEKLASLRACLHSAREELNHTKSQYQSLIQSRGDSLKDSTVVSYTTKNDQKTKSTKMYIGMDLQTKEDQPSGTMTEPGYTHEKKEKDDEIGKQEMVEGASETHIVKNLVSKLDANVVLSQSLKAELASFKEQELKQREELYATEASHSKSMRDLEILKTEAAKYAESHKEITVQLESTREKLDIVTQEISSLTSWVEELREELKKEISVLEKTQQRMEAMSIKNSSLQEDLNRIQDELHDAKEKEKEAKKALSELPKLLQQASAEADKTKAEVAEANRELNKAKQEKEQYRASTTTVECRIEASIKMEEACKASESSALARIKALRQSELASGYCVRDKPSCVTLSLEDYNALNTQAKQAEDLAERRLASILCNIDSAESCKQRVSKQLASANKIIMSMREALKAALERKDRAIQAKLMVEDHLRKRRAENTVRRKIGESGGVSKRHSGSHHRTHHRKLLAKTYQDNANHMHDKENLPTKPLQSLGHVLSMNASLQSKLGDCRLLNQQGSSKKKFKLPRFGITRFGRRRSL